MLPIIAVSIMSASSSTMARRQYCPDKNSISVYFDANDILALSPSTLTREGLYSSLISSNFAMFLPAEMLQSDNDSGLELITSSAWVPTDPVAPSMDIFFIYHSPYQSLNL